MQLSKNILRTLAEKKDSVPAESIFNLPEKVLQFGTGVLLRALPDYFIDKANKQGIFNGRIVVIKSTDSGNLNEFASQDSLYTICERGVENGKIVTNNILNASTSRVLNAQTAWSEILACAHNKEMQIIISNTTEVGIQLMRENITGKPPLSFPGKLLAFLYERYKAFSGSADSGMVIIPTELITDNGIKLKNIVVELALYNAIEPLFLEWLENCNSFCNSLVDRIVPGRPQKNDLEKIETELGYSDRLLAMSEVFRLWAIEGDEEVKRLLSFANADAGVIITPDITLFKELKLRLLNGTHTFSCGLAYLYGFIITRDAVADKTFSVFMNGLMRNEIAIAIPYEIDNKVKDDFITKVLERFANPYIDHQWLNITLQYSSKMKMRNLPLLKKYFELNQGPPMYMCTAFAAYILFMKVVEKKEGRYFGERAGVMYEIKDDFADYFYRLWQNGDRADLVKEVLSNKLLWEEDLNHLPGFCKAVISQLDAIIEKGAEHVVRQLINFK